jgi:hypothetical protein
LLGKALAAQQLSQPPAQDLALRRELRRPSSHHLNDNRRVGLARAESIKQRRGAQLDGCSKGRAANDQVFCATVFFE